MLILTAIEEVVVGWIHGRGAWQSVTGIGGGTLLQFIANVILLFLIFFPYFALHSLGEVAGDGVLFRLFFLERRKLEVSER